MGPTPIVLNQYAFWARKEENDDDDSSAGFITGAKDFDWTQDVDSEFRIRYLVQETSGGNAKDVTCTVEYAIDTGGGYGSWITITGSTPIQYTTGIRTNGSHCDQSYLTGTGTQDTENNGYSDDGSAGGVNFDPGANGHGEVEFLLIIDSAQVDDGDTIKVRINEMDAWNSVPEITVSVPAQEEMSGSSSIVLSSSAELEATGELAGSSSIVVTASGTLELPAGDMSGSSAVAISASGSLIGTTALEGSSSIVVGASGALGGVGELSGAAAIVLEAAGALQGAVFGAGSSSITIASSGSPSGTGALAGSSSVVLLASGEMAADAVLAGSSAIVVTASGALLLPTSNMAGSAAIVIGASGRLVAVLENVRIVLIEHTLTVADGDKLRIRGVRTSGSDSAITVPEASYLLVER